MQSDSESQPSLRADGVSALEATLQRVIDSLRQDMSARFTTLESAVGELKNRVELQEGGANRVGEQLAQLSERMGGVSAQVSGLQSSVNALSERMSQQELGARRLREQLSDSMSREHSVRKASSGLAPAYFSEMAPTSAPFHQIEREQRPGSQVAQ